MEEFLGNKRISTDGSVSTLEYGSDDESYDRSIAEPEWVDESFFDRYVEIQKRNFILPTEYVMSHKFLSLKGFINNAISKIKKLRTKDIPYRIFERVLYRVLAAKLKGNRLENELVDLFIRNDDSSLMMMFGSEPDLNYSNGDYKRNFVVYGTLSEWGTSNLIAIVNI